VRIDAADLSSGAAYKLITGAVVPRPIAWVTSCDEGGLVNLAPFSCFTYLSAEPILIGINISRRLGRRKDTANNIRATGEFVVNIPSFSSAGDVQQSGEDYPVGVSEVEELGLELRESSAVRPPRLADARVALECALHRIVEFGDAGNEFFVGEVKQLQVADAIVSNDKISTEQLDPLGRIAGRRYSSLGTIASFESAGPPLTAEGRGA